MEQAMDECQECDRLQRAWDKCEAKLNLIKEAALTLCNQIQAEGRHGYTVHRLAEELVKATV